MTDILNSGAAEIARMIRERVITPWEAVEAHIQRIEQVNPTINAVITPMFEQARDQARQATARITEQGTDGLPPLFGVPITIKDSWAVKNVRFTGGSWYHRDDIAADDAEAVRLLCEAGAIILGKTNLPDMCWSGETSNPIFGRTNNPHDTRHTAGGSSGGEGAIIAAGGSPLGLGSDIAGSVRIPAAVNGCVSLKPTAGRIPSDDHFPLPPEGMRDWNTAGLMARRIEDLALALSVLSRTSTEDHTRLSLAGRRCVVYTRNRIAPVRRPVFETVNRASNSLKQAGMEVVSRDWQLPMEGLMLAYFALMRKHGNGEFRSALGGGQPYRLLSEIGHVLRGRPRISPEVLFFASFADLMGLVASILGLADERKVDAWRQVLLDEMGEDGVMLTPLMLTIPPKHGWIYRVGFEPPYTTMFNLLGFPAVIVPIRYTVRGLPLAVQVVATPGSDEVALAAAAKLEEIHGGWKMAKV